MAECRNHGRLKYYSRELNPEGTLHILMVSTSDPYLDLLAKNLYITREVQKDKRSYNLKVHTCKSISDVLQLTSPEFYVDFIVFILDTKICTCLAEIENNLMLIDLSFANGKICIVNPDFNFGRSVVSPIEIWDFVKKNQYNLINGETKDNDGVFNITKRILNLAEACCGILNGIPMVNMV